MKNVRLGLATLLLMLGTVIFAQASVGEWQKLNDEVRTLAKQGNYERALVAAKKSLQVAEKDNGPNHTKVAASLNNLAMVYNALNQNAQAEPLYKRSLAIREKALGPNHLDVATSLNNMAGLYMSQGKFDKAEPLFKRSLAIKEKALGANHPEVAASLENLAALYNKTGQHKKADPLQKRAATIMAHKQR